MNNRTPLVLLAMVSALGPMAIDMGLPALPALEQGFALATGQGALTLTVFLLGFGLSPVLSGLLSDRFGRKRVLTVSLFAFSLFALLCSLAENYTWLLIFRVLQGLFAGASVALPIAIVRDQIAETRAGPYIARIAMIVGLAPIVAPALGTLVLTFSGWRGIYLAQAALGLALTVWCLASLSDRPDFKPGRFAGIVGILRSARQVYGNRGFLLPTLIYATLFSAMFSFLTAAPAVFIQDLGFSELHLILVLALTSCGMFSGSLLNSYLLRHSHAKPVTLIRISCMVAFMACLLLAMIALATQPHYSVIVLFCWLLVFVFGISAPSSNHQAIYALDTHRGLGAGFIRTIQMLMAAAAGTATSLLTTLIPALTAFALVMAVMATAALLIFWYWQRQ
ncbi:MAG TPA: MFS transporter [Marinobacter sp.]|nr:MFS transporter [Marinobacter sp.]